ncbi:hypothetical protein GGR53DRAFT_524840 [Hypoxylon sp. FL1150]|nr:hypothetical protein GGR53DRAFT_524840 [Hypoxylon sp. FL1150]
MSPSFSDGLPVNYQASYNGVKDTRPNCSTQSTGGSSEASNLESYYMPSPTTHGTHISRQSQSQQQQSHSSDNSSSLLAAAINPSIATYSNPHHLHSASSSQSMLATPPSTTYEGEDLDHYSYHGSPTSGGQPLAPSSAHPSAPSPRGWSPLDSQPMGFQQQFLRSPEPMLTYNFRDYAPGTGTTIHQQQDHHHHQHQVHSQVSSSSPYQSQDFAPTTATASSSLDVDAMAHHDVVPPAIAGLRDLDHAGAASQTDSPELKQEGGSSSYINDEGADLRHSSREGQPLQQPQPQQNGEEGGKVDEPYAQLIHRAFMSRDPHAMTLQEIYQWFRENTEKGKSDNKGWQNSIRHNLSMNRAFSKRELKQTPGEPLTGLRGSKKLSEWYLMPWAINGVQSTTRYRTKGTARRRQGGGAGGVNGSSTQSCVNSSRRALSGRKGGLTASKSKAKKASQDRAHHHHHHHHHQQHNNLNHGAATSGYGGGSSIGGGLSAGSHMHHHHHQQQQQHQQIGGGGIVLDPNMGFPYGVPDPITPPEHNPADIMMPHNPMQTAAAAAALPIAGGHGGFGYPAPEMSQYGHGHGGGGGQYPQQPHNMYALDEVTGMYPGQQQVTVPSNGGQAGQGQASQGHHPHSMSSAISPLYGETDEMRRRGLAFHYQNWNESVQGNSFQQ